MSMMDAMIVSVMERSGQDQRLACRPHDPVTGGRTMAAAFARVNLRLTYATPKPLIWLDRAAAAALTLCATA